MGNLGESIRKFRKEKGLKVCELAEKIKVAPEFITLVETGNRLPSEKNLMKIMEVLGCDVRTLYYNEKYADMIVFFKKHRYLIEMKHHTVHAKLKKPKKSTTAK